MKKKIKVAYLLDKSNNWLEKYLKKYPKISAKAQKGKSSYYRKRKIDDQEININSTIKKSFNKLRIGNNEKWPSYFYLKKKIYN